MGITVKSVVLKISGKDQQFFSKSQNIHYKKNLYNLQGNKINNNHNNNNHIKIAVSKCIG